MLGLIFLLLLAMCVVWVLKSLFRAPIDLANGLSRDARGLTDWLQQKTEMKMRRACAVRGLPFPEFCTFCGQRFAVGARSCPACRRPRIT